MAITELVGVYDADGGLPGEVAYLWGKLRGTKHCGLCDITHSPLRRKVEWDRMAGSVDELATSLRRHLAAAGGGDA